MSQPLQVWQEAWQAGRQLWKGSLVTSRRESPVTEEVALEVCSDSVVPKAPGVLGSGGWAGSPGGSQEPSGGGPWYPLCQGFPTAHPLLTRGWPCPWLGLESSGRRCPS